MSSFSTEARLAQDQAFFAAGLFKEPTPSQIEARSAKNAELMKVISAELEEEGRLFRGVC